MGRGIYYNLWSSFKLNRRLGCLNCRQTLLRICVVCFCTFQPSTGIRNAPCFTHWQIIILQSCFVSNSHSFLVIFTAIKISNKRTPRFWLTLTLRPSIILDFRLTRTARVKRCNEPRFQSRGGEYIIIYARTVQHLSSPLLVSLLSLNHII